MFRLAGLQWERAGQVRWNRDLPGEAARSAYRAGDDGLVRGADWRGRGWRLCLLNHLASSIQRMPVSFTSSIRHWLSEYGGAMTVLITGKGHRPHRRRCPRPRTPPVA